MQLILFILAAVLFIVAGFVTPPPNVPARMTCFGLAVLSLAIGWTVLR